MKLPSGPEGYIGKDCAKEHFQQNHAFTAETVRARKIVDRKDLVERLTSLRSDPGRRDRIVATFTRQRELRERITRIRNALPYQVKDRLQGMTKTGNPRIRVEFEFLEKVEDESGNVHEVPRWRPDVIGSIVGHYAIDAQRIEALGERLRRSLTAFDHADVQSDRRDRELREWAESLEDAERCDSELKTLSDDLEMFLRPDNMQLLCWLCCAEADQLHAVRSSLQLASRREVTEWEARPVLTSLKSRLISVRGARGLRVP